MSEAETLWTSAAVLLREQVSEAVWLSTFQDVHATELDEAALVLSVPSTHVRDRIEIRYLPIVREALDAVGGDDLDLRFTVAAPSQEPPPELPWLDA